MSIMPQLAPAFESPRAPRINLESTTKPGQHRSGKEPVAGATDRDFTAVLARRRPAAEKPAAGEPEQSLSPLSPPPPIHVEGEGGEPSALVINSIAPVEISTESPLVTADTVPNPAAAAPMANKAIPAVLSQDLAGLKPQIVTARPAQLEPIQGSSPPATAVSFAVSPSEAPLVPATVTNAPVASPPGVVAATPGVEPLPVIDTAEATVPAAVLVSAVKGRQSYTQAPVVNESQLVAESLKEKTSTATTSVNAAEAGESDGALKLPELGSAPQADSEQQAGDPDHLDSPQPESVTSDTPAIGSGDKAATGSVSESAPTPSAAAGADLAPLSPVIDAAVSATGGTTLRKPPATTGAATDVARSVRQQVVRQVAGRLAGLGGQDKVTIKLNPESLGQLELKFAAKDDRLSVVITASGAEAEAALQDNLKDLTDRIVERSTRFSHVEVRVETKDGAESRQDGKQEAKQDGRQDQRREQSRRNDAEQNDPQRHDRQAQQSQQAWESAMSWQMADQAASEKG